MFLSGVAQRAVTENELTEFSKQYVKDEKMILDEIESVNEELSVNTALKDKIRSLEQIHTIYKQRLNSLSYEEKRTVCQLLISKIIIKDDKIKLQLVISKDTSKNASSNGIAPSSGLSPELNKLKMLYGGLGEVRTLGQLVKSQLLYH